ncbi:hypothetical protein [Streptomyces sp. NPDC019937]|uniref:hypothetical protein n=1 Tax=Streptomyces sp. NPDC019937 TaxID=3154787 RepID=UPI0033D4CD21
MADDHRYSWLDDKAAERLLRGEPVEGRHGTPDDRSDRPHAEAERLAAVLGAVAQMARRPDGAAPDDTAPLPGEEAAVAAFRAARAKPTVVPMSAEGQVGAESTRIARSDEAAAAPAARRTGWRGLRRPLRAGMVAAVAACTLSGFAVAAAAGVLPFGHGDGTPGPGASVSDTGPGAGESARPEISGGGGSSTAPDDTGGGTSEGPQGRGVPGGDEGHGKDKHGKHKGHGKHGKGEKGAPGARKTGTGRGNGEGQRAMGACRRYLAAEAGTGPAVGKNALNKLTRAAGSRSGIHDYCVRLVGADTVPRSGTNGTDDSGGGDDGSSHPAPPPPSGTPSGDDGGTPSPEPTTSGTSSHTLSGTPSGSASGSATGSHAGSASGSPSAQQSEPTKPAKSGAP